MDRSLKARLAGLGISSAEAACEPLDGLAEKYSGARLERLVLEDGRKLVLKRFPSKGDWLTRATHGEGRLVRLWTSGLLNAVSPVVDHTVLDCVETARGSIAIMRDASADLLPPVVPVSRATSARLLQGLARLHEVNAGEPVDWLCSLADRYRLFAPDFHRDDAGPGRHPSRDRIVAGWDLFWDVAPPEIAAAVRKVHEDPFPLARALERFPQVLLHGDAKLENLGISSDRPVLIDWGDLTGFGPVEVEVGWFALKGAARIGVDPAELFDDYEVASGRRLDPEAVALVSLGCLAQMGFRMANSITHGVPEPQTVGRAHLRSWSDRVARYLDRIPY